MQNAMREASAAVLGGFGLRTDVTRIEAPNQFSNPRGVPMSRLVNELLDEIDRGAEHAHA